MTLQYPAPSHSQIKWTLPLRVDPQQLIFLNFFRLKDGLDVKIIELLPQQRKYPAIRGVVQQEYKVKRWKERPRRK